MDTSLRIQTLWTPCSLTHTMIYTCLTDRHHLKKEEVISPEADGRQIVSTVWHSYNYEI